MDCGSRICAAGACASPTCTDGAKNGSESDVDCGGSCPTCAIAKACGAAKDCISGVCTGGFCAAPTCTDTVKNGGETDSDCGGSCTGCGVGKKCGVAADCASQICILGACAAPSCTDGLKNGAETDVDCGGGCLGCAVGKTCVASSDCKPNICFRGSCSPLNSCKALKASDPTLITGVYTIDPDGAGPIVPIQVVCEMLLDGGGWTLGIKRWYQSGGHRYTAELGAATDGLSHKGSAYKLADDVIRALIGPSKHFEVMADQSGHNSFWSSANYEYVVLRNYTADWRFDTVVQESSTATTLESYRRADGRLAWSGRLSCNGYGGAGINCYLPLVGNPMGGAACAINMGHASRDPVNNPEWHHFFMSDTNTDTYLYFCNGPQHSSGHDMNHRFWFREY
jgi:hypothetical protein